MRFQNFESYHFLLAFLLFFFQSMSYAMSCEEAFSDSGEMFSNPSSFAEAMTRGLVLREGQDDLFKFYLKNWTPYPENGRIVGLQSVFEILTDYPSLSKIPLRDYIFEFATVRKERPQSLINFITSFKSKSNRIQNNLFHIEENLGFWIKMFRGKEDHKAEKKALREKRKQERQDFIAWLDTTSLNKELRDFIKDPQQPYRERVIALYKALAKLRSDFLNAEQKANETSPEGSYEKTIQRISQAMVDLIYTSGFGNKVWMEALKDANPQENLNALRNILIERDNIAFELGFMGHFAELVESLKAKVPNDVELLSKITEDVRSQPHTIEGTEVLRLRRLSLQESPFRSCMGGDCATDTYFERALDPNFLYFTLTDSRNRSSGHITVVLGESFNHESQRVKTAFVDKIQNMDIQRLKALLEGVRLSMQEQGYVLALPKVIGGENGLSNEYLINNYVESSVLPELQRSLIGFNPHDHGLSFESAGYSRAYSNLELLEFEGATRLELVKIRPGDFPTQRFASSGLNVRSLYQRISSFKESNKDAKQLEFLSNFLILSDVFSFSTSFSREHLYFVMRSKHFSFQVRKRAFYTLIELEPRLQEEEKGQTVLKRWNFSFFKRVISNEEGLFFSESERQALLGEMSNWKNTTDYRKEFIRRFSDSELVDSVYELSQALDGSFWGRVLDKNYMLQQSLQNSITLQKPENKLYVEILEQNDGFNKEIYRDIMLLLLEKGADPNVRDADGETALMLAIRAGSTELVRLLLDNGADLNTRDNHRGNTALILAVRAGSTEVMRLLLEKGVDPNIRNNREETALMGAVEERSTEVTRLLLDNGADPNLRNNTGETALILAVRAGSTEVTRLLLDNGADPNIRDADGNTALIVVVRKKNTEIMQLLLDNGADPNVHNNGGKTALMVAVQAKSTKKIQLLLDKGADPNIRDADGETALMGAIRAGSTELVRLLLDNGADPNVRNNHGEVALMVAVEVRSTKKTQLLLDKGADPNIRDVNGSTVLMKAIRRNYIAIELVRLLLENGMADPNVRNNRGETALMLAVQARSTKKMQLLLDKGANPNARDIISELR